MTQFCSRWCWSKCHLGQRSIVSNILSKDNVFYLWATPFKLVTIPLSITTSKVGRDSIAQVKITNIVNQWISQYPGDFVIKSVLVSVNEAKVLISRAETPTTIEDLGEEILANVQQVVKVDLRFIHSRFYKFPWYGFVWNDANLTCAVFTIECCGRPHWFVHRVK